MPEYLAPGVYVEEVSFRSKSIEGVSTTTTGFIGPARFGPLDLQPSVLTSVGDFERVYGDRQQLQFHGVGTLHNFLWHATRAFFEEGGSRLYVSRVFAPLAGTYPPDDFGLASSAPKTVDPALYDDGHARAAVGTTPDHGIQVRARFPGAAGNMRVRFTLRVGQNVLSGTSAAPNLGSVVAEDVIRIARSGSSTGAYFLAEPFFDTSTQTDSWRFVDPATSPPGGGTLSGLHEDPADPEHSDTVTIVTLTVTVWPADGSAPLVWANLPLDPRHARAGSTDSVTALFAQQPANLDQARSLPLVITLGGGVTTGLGVLNALFGADSSLHSALEDPLSTDVARSIDVLLTGGNDGQRPTADLYAGSAAPDSLVKTGLKAFEDIDDISIVAAPGSTFGYEDGYRDQAATIVSELIIHATTMRYRIAVLDSGDAQSLAQVRAMRGKIDSTYAALYYPWVRVLDPVTQAEINLPPSGFVSGIYARNDINRAVYKAPANEVVNLALGFETLLNKAQQDVLNPEGINCFRFFEGRGYRLWGARLASSDPEWNYVNLRRYFAYLEHSIDRGTQWAVFEPNGPALWDNVRRTIDAFLYTEWESGALLGDKPEKAYFVRCDRSTMTQNDLDNGRLVCLIGVAALRPAEFVIFRIGQWTADRPA
jgi:uncharacterized protein